MSKNKRYYWIKLSEKFFKSKELKMLRKSAGGDTYAIVYLKLMLASLEDNGELYYDGLAKDLAEELAILIDEEEEDVRVVLSFLQNKKLITFRGNGIYFLEQVPEMTGSETDSTRRSRKHREIKASSQKALQCNADATKRNTEKEKEIEKEKKIEKREDTKKIKNLYKENTYIEYIDKNKSDVRMYPNGPLRSTKGLKEISNHSLMHGMTLNGHHAETIQSYLDDGLEVDLIKFAFDKASDKGKMRPSYIMGILDNWFKMGIRTVEQAEENDRKYSKQFQKEVYNKYSEEVDPFDYN